MKRCTKCNGTKPRSEFYKRARSKDNLGGWCKACWRAYRQSPEYKATKAKYLKNNRELVRQRNHQWQLNNPGKSKKACRNWYRRTKNKITTCLGNRVYESLGKNFNRKKLWKILGYSYGDLIKHIEEQFQPGMTWDNHGEWEFDHIIPISFFCFQSSEDVEFKMCWRLENIQPLWAHQNHVKGIKIL